MGGPFWRSPSLPGTLEGICARVAQASDMWKAWYDADEPEVIVININFGVELQLTFSLVGVSEKTHLGSYCLYWHRSLTEEASHLFFLTLIVS